jgi:uncharacterized membrane protein
MPVTIQQTAMYAGPIPTPELLRGYKDIDPTFAERIVKMAEKHVDADVLIKNEDARAIKRGQIFSFVVCILGLAAAVVLAVLNLQPVAIAAALTGVSPIIISALTSNKRP